MESESVVSFGDTECCCTVKRMLTTRVQLAYSHDDVVLVLLKTCVPNNVTFKSHWSQGSTV